MSYNILAQCLVRGALYPYATHSSLRQKNRRKRLMEEILHWHPDIACLQEVEPDVFQQLKSSGGYEGAFAKHPEKRHGCCILWNKRK